MTEFLEPSEVYVLDGLDDSPQSLPEVRGNLTVEYCVPGLVSLVARGLIEVRRFDRLPAPWEEGTPVTGTELEWISGRWETWCDGSPFAAHITPAGRRLL